MNDGQFLFELPSKKIAEHVQSGEWISKKMKLKGKEGLGMDKDLRATTEYVVEQDVQADRRPAQIKIHGDGKKVPREIERTSDGYVYTIPIWVESPVTIRSEKVMRERKASDQRIV
ncbi:hypothetical protein H5410_030924 [Solanum commersonii]|uniref:Uncharacterized protein n=1 Tax=Solanum commersonii TaxID=4109 RepID=A0A9J5YGZ1_SOLCO|nr:hypothetical protein H5410_030924 [Solanum commersonii]